jgi:nucleotide-binding universal stress UspA family protein
MPGLALLCTDGSDLSVEALAAGLAVLGPGVAPVVVTVVEPSDPALVTGTGFAGGVMSADELTAMDDERRAEATETLTRVVADLGLDGADTRVLDGSPGQAICDLADEADAAVVVIGSRGRGGLKRAVLGSVSDHVVRHAPCPVVVTTPK